MKTPEKRRLRDMTLAQLEKKLEFLKTRLKQNQKETNKMKYIKYHIRRLKNEAKNHA